MSISKEPNVVSFARKQNDTGSPEFQIALLSRRISIITEHLKVFRKDHQATIGLLSIVNKRKRLLKYLYRIDKDKFMEVIKRLKIKMKV
jgi:small subunit ribosomal protein S15